jgi:hypothetical protein
MPSVPACAVRTTSRLAALAALGMAMVACGGEVRSAMATGVTVTVYPPVANAVPSGTVPFAAVVTGTTSQAVTWSVSDQGGGTVDSSGLYSAPGTVGTFHIVATSVADPSKSGTAIAVISDSTVDTSILPADRRTVWNPGLNSMGGIPYRTTIYKTINAGASMATIQSALDSAPANTVVMLGPGTFNITGQGLTMNRSGVTLRGSGPDSTILSRTDSSDYPVIIMGERWYWWGDPRNFTSDAVKGASSVTVASVAGLTVGEIVHVDELYDSGLTWYNTYFGDQGISDYNGWGEGRTGSPANSRPIGQAMEIASIAGNTVTFTTPFHISFRTSKSAHLTRIRNGSGNVISQCKLNGIENLKVQNGRGGDGGGNIRIFAPTQYSWLKNIESYNSTGASVAFDGAFRCELRDSYLHSTTSPNPGGAGYGIVLDTYTADTLVENNISWDFNKVIIMRSSGGGNVVGYNYMEDGYGAGYQSLQEVGLNAAHMAGTHMELFEGNQAFNIDSDSRWGGASYIAFFRNHATGRRRSLVSGVNLTDTNARHGGLTYGHWWYSFVGNVLGTQSEYQAPVYAYRAQQYEAIGTGANGGTYASWRIGYNGDSVGPKNGTTQPEIQTCATVLRNGNWDWYTQSQRWHGIGGPVGAGTPVTLPPSLYLANKPAFMGANPWPWVDPTNGATYVLPARARFDAGTPNSVP